MTRKSRNHFFREITLCIVAIGLCTFLFIHPAAAKDWNMNFFEWNTIHIANLEYPNFSFELTEAGKEAYENGTFTLTNIELSDVDIEPEEPLGYYSYRVYARARITRPGQFMIGDGKLQALAQTDIPEELIGVWESPQENKTWTDRWTFCQDGTFTHLVYPKRTGQSSADLQAGKYGYSNGYIDTTLNTRFVFDGKTLYRYNGQLVAVKKVGKKTANMKSLKLTRYYPEDSNGDAILAGLGYKQPGRSEPRGIPLVLTMKPDAPLNGALNFQISDPDILEVLGYDYYRVYVKGKKAGIAQIYAEAADGTGVKSNPVEIRVLEGEASLPDELLNKRWDFVSDGSEWKSHFVFNSTGQYYYFQDNGRCECGSYRYLDGMIQTDSKHNKILFIEERNGQPCLRSYHGSGRENPLNSNANQGVFYPAELLIGKQSLGEYTYMFDENGIPYDSTHPVDWKKHYEYHINPIQ